MDKPMVVIASNLSSLACVIGAILLAMNDKPLWGEWHEVKRLVFVRSRLAEVRRVVVA